MKKKYPLISIIISNYNGVKLNILQECLKSFKKIDYPNYEILLVDNASTDNSIKVAEKIFYKNPKFKIIKNPINMYSQGVNLGFKESNGDYIALFNNDIELGKKYLQRLLSAFKKYPKLAYAQGKFLWYFDHSIIDSAGETMDIYGNPATLGYKTKDTGFFDKDEEILSASGAACLIRRSSLEKVGIYDSKYGIGYEDMDHSLRFLHHGFIIMRISEAVCYHKRGVTDLSSMVRVKVRWHFNKNRLVTMIRNYPLQLLLKALPITLLLYFSNMLWEILILRNIELALTRPKAVWWVLQNLSYLIACRKKIRSEANSKTDKKILKLFSKSDLTGKIKAVILDKISFTKIQYFLPWTYPAKIKKLIPNNSTILDVGCGDGHLMAWINSMDAYKVVGIDINQQDLSIAKKRKCFFRTSEPVYQEVILADIIKKFPFKKKFDVVLCSQVIEHLEKDRALELIQKIENLAKKRVIVATTNGFFQFDSRVPAKHDIHLSGWSPQEFIAAGFSVQGSGLKCIYKPGSLKGIVPKFLHPLFFAVSYLATPILRYYYPASLLLITHKNLNE